MGMGLLPDNYDGFRPTTLDARGQEFPVGVEYGRASRTAGVGLSAGGVVFGCLSFLPVLLSGFATRPSEVEVEVETSL